MASEGLVCRVLDTLLSEEEGKVTRWLCRDVPGGDNDALPMP